MKLIIIGVFGIGAGIFTASGIFALITSITIVNRIAAATDTSDKMVLYENMICLGAIIGNIQSMSEFTFAFPEVLALIAAVAFGLLSGMYVGVFAASLAETIKSMPVMFLRMGIKEGIGIIIVMYALGKGFGHIVYYLCQMG